MDARFYNSEDIDIQRLAGDLVNIYLSQGYQAQQFGNADQTMIQIKKGGEFEAIIGMQAAISLTLQHSTGGTLAMIGQQRWIDKAAVGAVGIVAFPVLWPLALTAGAGALRQASLGNQVLNVVDNLVHQQRPGLSAGPIPQYLLPQVKQQWQMPNNQQQQQPYYIPSNQAANPPALPAGPAPVVQANPVVGSGLHCPNCNTPYEPGDTFCTGCGRPLAAPRQYCTNCHSELKPGLSFCPKCGASVFQSGNAQQPASYNNTASPAASPQVPTYQPPAAQPAPSTPVYQPPVQQPAPAPRPQAPVYQPPVQPAAQPQTPVYQPPKTQTPASPPQKQVYYTPSQQPATPPMEKQPKKPEEPYYVPPVTQEPAVKPQPKVTMVQGTPHQTPPPPKKQPPQKQYYIPSQPGTQNAPNPSQPGQASQATINDQPTLADQPMPTQPTIVQSSAAPAANSGAPWGTLLFEGGEQQQLSGERIVIGRYDHDLGGIRPDIDLASAPNADTVSRVHASLDNSGGSYLLTDLNSTNATRVNGTRLEPDKPTPINDGDKLTFGKVNATFKRS